MPSILPGASVRRTLSSIFIVALFILPFPGAMAETYVFDGTAGSVVRVTGTTTIHVSGIDIAHIANGSKLIFNATYPTSSPPDINGYSATYSNIRLDVSPAPSYASEVRRDQFNNQFVQYVWEKDRIVSSDFDIVITTQFDADVRGDLSPLSYDDPVGTPAFPEFRSSTDMAQSDDPAIIEKKNALLAGVTSEAQAVDRIISFVKANIPVQDTGVQKDAVSSLGSHKGNCVNRVHLALALLWSAGIPARCVSGLVYGDKYVVTYPYGGGTASTDVLWGSGSHVWLEVYYPGEKAWIAYDPWMEKGFVDSRHLRLAAGRDFDPKNPLTRGSAGLMYVSGFNPEVSISTAVSTSGLRDSYSLRYWYTEPSPDGTFMMGRSMQSSTAPTWTPTPTIRPNNTTATPKPSELPGTTPNPTPAGGDVARYNLSGTIIDQGNGRPVQGAIVMLDSIQLNASQSGRFLFLNALSGGMYNLTVSAPGYVADRRAIVPNGGDMDVTIILKAEKASARSSSPWNPLPGPGFIVALAALACGALLRGKRKP